MWKSAFLLLCLSGYCCAGPVTIKRNMSIKPRDDEPVTMELATASEEVKPEDPATNKLLPMSTLTLPSNATSIRADITDNFSCDNKTYGYYADAENDCQIFHVCLPVTYADGKENTFRWSFICPEDTVFSQESFTCLRREDMTIDCEESFKYYDLNRNFGMIEEETNKNTQTSNTPMMTNDEQEPAMTMQTIVQQPMEEQPMPALIQPMKEPKKPIKEIKKPMPNRRKPAQTAAVNKKKTPTVTAHPLRKVEKPSEKPADLAQVEETVPIVEKQVVKLLNNQRFTKRPSTMSTNFKEKIQSPKPQQVVPNRGELFNQVRKRPTSFNKKDTTVKLAEQEKTEEPLVIAQPALEEPEPTLHLESIFTPLPAAPLEKDEIDVSEPIEPLVVAISAPENLAAASETSEVFVKPMEEETALPEKTKEVQPEKPTEPEVIQQSEATVENNDKSAEDEKDTPTVASNEKELIDTKTTVEVITDIATDLPAENAEPEISETADNLVESTKAQDATQPIEAIEEVPAVILEVEEQQPVATEELKVEDETAMNIKSTNPAEILTQGPADSPVESPIVPSGITSDVLSPSLEELEDARPANALETMNASPDMLVQDPLVQEMFPNTNSLKESSGGFKPVDPAMAAEAEALISDFLNTLMKSDNSNNKPIYPGESHIDSADNEEIKSQSETSVEEEKEPLPATSDIKEEMMPAKEEADAQKLKNGAAFSNVLMQHSLPDSMYQIPVKVITTPAEADKTAANIKITEEETAKLEENSVEENIVEADKLENDSDVSVEPDSIKLSTDEGTLPVALVAQPVLNLQQNIEASQQHTGAADVASYAPLSIDDIVELVKERLDQVPTADKQTVPAAVEPQAASEEDTAAVQNSQNVIATPSEEFIMPLYHRFSPLAVEPNLLKAQNLLVNEPIPIEKNIEDASSLQEEQSTSQEETSQETTKLDEEKLVKTEAVQVPETQEPKMSRAYRSRSMKNVKMDPRKRRFLFRSDAS